MSDGERSTDIFRFGVFEADLDSRELRKNGLKVPLQGQPFQVFAILLRKSGKLVTREELRQELWPADTFVDFDHALNTAIAKIRAALSDSADNPRFVETLPRLGYRLIAPVDKPATIQIAFPDASNEPKQRFSANAKWLASVAALIVLLAGIAIWRHTRTPAESPLPSMEVVPLVGLPGTEGDPAFSPDGNQVAFTIRNLENSGIYTTLVGGEKSLRVTHSPGDCCVRWSPDGRQLAFIRYSPEQLDIYVIPAMGGTEHRVFSGTRGITSRYMDWSPKGKVLAITDISDDRTHTWIALLSLADGSKRRLSSPSDQEVDSSPAFSPDGKTIAFIRGSIFGVVSDLYVMPSAGGAPKRLTNDNTWIFGSPTWTPDGRELVFSSTRGGLPSLWRISASGGTPRPVLGAGQNVNSVSISPKGNQLVYQQMDSKQNVWRVNLKDEKTREGSPVIVLSDKSQSMARATLSPDGKRIAFESDRLGFSDIWMCNSNGSDCGQLSSLHGVAGAPSWSPDGRNLAFEFRPKDHTEIYLLEVDGGTPHLLKTLPGADNGGPRWSQDGKWLYFYSDNGGGPTQIWKMNLSGGSPMQVTRHGGAIVSESSDGRFLYYAKTDVPGFWRMPVEGGDETLVLDLPFMPFAWWNWALAPNGIYYQNYDTEPHVTIEYFEFATRKTFPISTLTNHPFLGLSVSSDGKSILYSQNEYDQSDLMIVRNFR